MRSRPIPLRVKLIALVVGLSSAALGLIGVVSVVVLHGRLVADVDGQLVAAVRLDDDLTEPVVAPPSAASLPLPSDFVIQVRGPDGAPERDIRSPLRADGSEPVIPADSAWLTAHRGAPVTVPGRGGGSWRVLVDSPQADGDVLVVAVDLARVEGTVRLLAVIEGVVGAVAVLGLAVVGAAAVRRSLRPLVEIERTAALIAAGRLDQRVPDRDGRTEIGRLGRSLNTMLARIETAFAARSRSEERMRRFVADAGHELRTPISIIRGHAEHSRRGHGVDAGELVTTLGRVEREATRMGQLVDDLLLLARLDRERPPLRQPVDLLAVVGEAVGALRVVAADRPVDLAVDPDAAFLVTGDPARLRQVIDNLLVNARTHTPPGTPIAVRLRTADLNGSRAAQVTVTDQGPGLTPDQAARAFDRFYRADHARSRDTGGAGLGLAIVAALVTAHSGHVEIDTSAAVGATFRITLPLSTPPP